MALSSKSCKFRKEGTLTGYREVINYLLVTYVTDDGIAEMDAEILQFAQPMQTEYAEPLWRKKLHCNLVYDAFVLRGIYIEGLHSSIRHRMLLY